jgi:hypothetical protein
MEDAEREATREFLKMGVPRQFSTSDEDYQEHGYNRGCLGCKALLREQHDSHTCLGVLGIPSRKATIKARNFYMDATSLATKRGVPGPGHYEDQLSLDS